MINSLSDPAPLSLFSIAYATRVQIRLCSTSANHQPARIASVTWNQQPNLLIWLRDQVLTRSFILAKLICDRGLWCGNQWSDVLLTSSLEPQLLSLLSPFTITCYLSQTIILTVLHFTPAFATCRVSQILKYHGRALLEIDRPLECFRKFQRGFCSRDF